MKKFMPILTFLITLAFSAFSVCASAEAESEGTKHFSPDGGIFVLEQGNLSGAEVTYEVYDDEAEDAENIGEFSGIRGQIAWVDSVRFVMTRIDDTREFEEEPESGPAFAWRVSVVMYDTAAQETTVLKEATDTRNFWFEGVIEDGSAVTVREESVKSKKDWSDEEKIKTREIRVEIPAAG